MPLFLLFVLFVCVIMTQHTMYPFNKFHKVVHTEYVEFFVYQLFLSKVVQNLWTLSVQVESENVYSKIHILRLAL